jgi:hypothetical protein
MKSAYKNAALVLGVVIVVAAAVPTFAASAEKIQQVFVTNSSANPVPVEPTPPPLWQGTSYIDERVVLGAQCNDMGEIPSGQVFFAQRVIVDFNVAPGQTGSAKVRFTPLGAGSPESFDIPSHPSAPASQVAGNYDRYMGVLELGQPVTGTPEACMFASGASDIAGSITLMGYLVPAS